jgi:hypothetical protein
MYQDGKLAIYDVDGAYGAAFFCASSCASACGVF